MRAAAIRTRLGPVLTTASVLRGAVEVRIVRMDAVPLTAQGRAEGLLGTLATGLSDEAAVRTGPWRLRIGGAALAAPRQDGLRARVGPDRAAVDAEGGQVSAVIALAGPSAARGFEAGVTRRRDANPFGRWSATPWVRTTGPVAAGEIHAVAVLLGRVRESAAEVAVTLAAGDAGRGEVVAVVWPDGERDLVPLGEPLGGPVDA